MAGLFLEFLRYQVPKYGIPQVALFLRLANMQDTCLAPANPKLFFVVSIFFSIISI